MEFDRIQNIFGDRLGEKRGAIIFTPANIAEFMMQLPGDAFWTPDRKIFDIYVKSGRLLKAAYDKLFSSPYLAYMNPKERREHILTKQLYGFCQDKTALALAQRLLYGRIQTEKCNIVYIKSLEAIVANEDKSFIYKRLKEEFEIMQFDLVVSNPPYNNGMDLDFVIKSYNISSKYTVMITPAKWQTAEANQRVSSKNIIYGEFRAQIVPHMSKVVFYPDCKDIFDIGQIDGTSYYILDKDIHSTCTVENRCKMQKYFNSIADRDIRNGQSLHNIGNDIVEYIKKTQHSGDYTRFKFGYTYSKRYEVYTNTQMASGSRDGMQSCLLTTTGDSQYIGVSTLVDTQKDDKPSSSTAKVQFSSDTEIESRSFLSWLDSKFVRFFLAINISKLSNIMDDNFFKFAPAPPSGKFDHIYTDEELYKAFKLPQKYIDVIEAVIKERK